MKPIHIIAGLGATAVVALAGWYMYMSQTPTYERSFERGLPEKGAVEAPADPAEAEKPVEEAAPAEPAAAPAAEGAEPAAAPAAAPAVEAAPAEPAPEGAPE